jgi:hypothetical protein
VKPPNSTHATGNATRARSTGAAMAAIATRPIVADEHLDQTVVSRNSVGCGTGGSHDDRDWRHP